MKLEIFTDAMTKMVMLCEDGKLSALDAFVALRTIEKTAGEYKQHLQNQALGCLMDLGGSARIMDMNVNLCTHLARWQYDHIPIWSECKQNLKEIEECAKKAVKIPTRWNGIYVEPAVKKHSRPAIMVSDKLY